MIILLFGDDMVISGNSVEELQSNLSDLRLYIMINGVWSGEESEKNVKWSYDNTLLETVDHFNYLGVVCNYTGSFQLHNQYTIGKVMKSQYVLFLNINKYCVTPSVSLQLFDVFVASTINNFSAIWGFTKS
jgi:hypothetical protein